jgi:hypothetical protein
MLGKRYVGDFWSRHRFDCGILGGPHIGKTKAAGKGEMLKKIEVLQEHRAIIRKMPKKSIGIQKATGV